VSSYTATKSRKQQHLTTAIPSTDEVEQCQGASTNLSPSICSSHRRNKDRSLRTQDKHLLSSHTTNHPIRLIEPPTRLFNQGINLIDRSIRRRPIFRINSDIAPAMRTSIEMRHTRLVRYKTLPAEIVAAAVACHVVASTSLFDVDAAFGTGLRAYGLDSRNGSLIFGFFGFVAARLGVPGPVAG
jgi:hypothetical protein